MGRRKLFREFKAQFIERKFVAGLLIAFIDFLDDLDLDFVGVGSYEELLEHFPRRTRTAAGKRANTLIVETGDGTLSLRPFYNRAEHLFRATNKRFDYPSCAPHATQAWGDYIPWIDALLGMRLESRESLRAKIVEFVLAELPSHEFDPLSVEVDPPMFRLVLEDFDMAARQGEKTGAAFQGIVFGFIRADNPHLQVEIEKVRTGSKRLQRVGDVDAWEGERLAVTAEVKQFEVAAKALPDLAAFANEATRRGAIAIVAALGFAEGAREALQDLGADPISREDMLRIVTLWDPVKQRTAVASFIFYVKHIEKNAALGERLARFLKDAEGTWQAERIEQAGQMETRSQSGGDR